MSCSGASPIAAASNPTIQPIIINSSIIADFHERQLSKPAAAIYTTPTSAASFKQREIQLSIVASDKSRCGGHRIDFTRLCDDIQP
jgi:hypothetical protein